MTISYCCKVNKVVCIEGDPTHHLLGSIDADVLIVIAILIINISIKKYMSRFKTNFILDLNNWCVGSPQNILLFLAGSKRSTNKPQCSKTFESVSNFHLPSHVALSVCF